MEIREVTTKSDLRKFINFIYHHYADDPMWVAPLRSEQRAQFDPKKNAMLEHCDYALFLAWEGDKILGRITAFVDHLAVEHWGEKIGLYGSYECIDDPVVADTLLTTARDWLKARGMEKMRGPWSFASQEWGLVIDGFEPEPVIMAPYNPGYYVKHHDDFGLKKVMDLLVYVIDIAEGYRIPERYLTLTKKVQKRYGITIRPIDIDRLEEEIAAILNVINVSLWENWGYVPAEESEAQSVAKDLKMLVHPESVLIADDPDGVPIGFSIPLPDINEIIRGMNGRIFPFGWLKLLRGIPKLNTYRLWALGVMPEYHGKGIDALLYRHTYDVFLPKEARIEINYVLETNVPMNNALKKLGVEDLRRYRVYEMAI